MQPDYGKRDSSNDVYYACTCSVRHRNLFTRTEDKTLPVLFKMRLYVQNFLSFLLSELEVREKTLMSCWQYRHAATQRLVLWKLLHENMARHR